MSLLEEAGLSPIALDLAGSGIDHNDANRITTLEEYSKPLINYLESLAEDEKVKICRIFLCGCTDIFRCNAIWYIFAGNFGWS